MEIAIRQILGALLTVLLTNCGGPSNPADTPATPPVDDGQTLTIGAAGAAWVAYQDGAGAWEVLEGAERHTRQPADPDKRYGVVHVCADEAEEVAVTLTHANVAARFEVATPCAGGEDEGDFYTLSGSVSGLNAGEAANVHGGFQIDVVTAEENMYSLLGFTGGEYDLLVTVQPPDTLSPPDKVLLTDDVSIESDQTLDIDLGNAAATTLQTVTVEDIAAADEVSSSLSLVTERGTSAELGYLGADDAGTGDTASYSYAALPPSSPVLENATYRLLLESFSEDGRGGLVYRTLTRTLADPGDLSVSLPDPLGEAALNPNGGQPELTWSAYAERADYTLTFEDFSEDEEEESDTRYRILLDDSYLTGSGYTLPDFSALPGWQDTWTLGPSLFWELTARVESEDETVSVSYSRSSSAADATSEAP